LLRREGVHEAQLDQWRQAADEATLSALGGRKQRSAEQKKVRQLERELKRKDKALAEAAALLVLQKKVRALWADEDESTTEGSDE
jgi:transposase-like protein